MSLLQSIRVSQLFGDLQTALARCKNRSACGLPSCPRCAARTHRRKKDELSNRVYPLSKNTICQFATITKHSWQIRVPHGQAADLEQLTATFFIDLKKIICELRMLEFDGFLNPELAAHVYSDHCCLQLHIHALLSHSGQFHQSAFIRLCNSTDDEKQLKRAAVAPLSATAISPHHFEQLRSADVNIQDFRRSTQDCDNISDYLLKSTRLDAYGFADREEGESSIDYSEADPLDYESATPKYKRRITVYELQTLNQLLALQGILSTKELKPRSKKHRVYHSLDPTGIISTTLEHKHAKQSKFAFNDVVARLRKSTNLKLDSIDDFDYSDEQFSQLLAELFGTFSMPTNSETPIDQAILTKAQDTSVLAPVSRMISWMARIYVKHRALNDDRFACIHGDIRSALKQADKYVPTMLPKSGRASTLRWKHPGNDEQAFFLAWYNLIASLESQCIEGQGERIGSARKKAAKAQSATLDSPSLDLDGQNGETLDDVSNEIQAGEVRPKTWGQSDSVLEIFLAKCANSNSPTALSEATPGLTHALPHSPANCPMLEPELPWEYFFPPLDNATALSEKPVAGCFENDPADPLDQLNVKSDAPSTSCLDGQDGDDLDSIGWTEFQFAEAQPTTQCPSFPVLEIANFSVKCANSDPPTALPEATPGFTHAVPHLPEPELPWEFFFPPLDSELINSYFDKDKPTPLDLTDDDVPF